MCLRESGSRRSEGSDRVRPRDSRVGERGVPGVTVRHETEGGVTRTRGLKGDDGDVEGSHFFNHPRSLGVENRSQTGRV